MSTIYAVTLPDKPFWTHSALARQLKTDRKTVRIYIEKIAGQSVIDFRRDLYRTPDGIVTFNMPLTTYQAWVVTQLILKGQEYRIDMKGLPIHASVRCWACDNANALSKAAWQACNEVNAA